MNNAAEEFHRLFGEVYEAFHVHWDSRIPKPSTEASAVLMHLKKSGPLTLSEASRHFDRSISATSELVDRMIAQGWVEKLPDPQDKRKKYVWITEHGEGVMRKACSVLDLEKLKKAFGNVSSKEQVALFDILKKIVEEK